MREMKAKVFASKQAEIEHISKQSTNTDHAARFEVKFNDVISYDGIIYRLWTRIVAYGALILVIAFSLILFQPSHWIVNIQQDSPTLIASWLMIFCLIMLQLFLIVGTYAATRSTLKAKDPIPVPPQEGLRVAFATTRAPGEPIEMVRTTLIAAKKVQYDKGVVDVWLLDETFDPALIAVCIELKVKYFTRKGIAKWNTPKPNSFFKALFIYTLQPFRAQKVSRAEVFLKHDGYLAAKSKHGNFNAWRTYMSNNGYSYDILAGVDTDQVPKPHYLMRLLGYFRDENVAYVVAPQVYGNYEPGMKGLVARWAESQASFFQSTIQRAGNATNSAMFVGTNYAVRTSVLDQIGGFQPCITEDMATGLAIHGSRNPRTGRRWKSVYIPDVLAIGEGPDFWAPYFTQQWRWAAGTFDTWRRVVWRLFFKLSPGAMLHYFLMLTYYPISALMWLFGMVSSMTYLLTGATAISTPWNQFMTLFMMMIVMQLSLYFWNRRHNVSPHEPKGSLGVAGMIISTITAPIYLSALVGILLGKKANFVVTTKGGSDNPDSIMTFKTHLKWAILLIAGLIYGASQGYTHPAMLLWVMMQLVICFTPLVLAMRLVVPQRLKKVRRMKLFVQVERQGSHV